MEDDDEFGDLYTDVLTPFAPSSSATQPPPHPPQSASTSLNLNRSIDLNIQSDDEEILFGASNSEKTDFNSSRNSQLTLVFDAGKRDEPAPAPSSGSHLNLNLEVVKAEGLAETGENLGLSDRFLDSGGQVKVQARGFEDPNFIDESAIDIVVDERDDKGDVLVDKDEDLVNRTENLDNFDIEEVNTGIGDLVSEDMIPGLSIPGVSDPANNRVGGGGADFLMRGEGSGEGDDWDSDSEDDLQIVLNDNDHGPMAMDRTGVAGADDDDEDEDGEPLVIVADSDPNHQTMEDQDWGEEAAQGTDGERKELGDAAKVNGGVAQPPKIPYNSHVYHPFHSQFKYVRPGAAPMPGAAPVAPGGAPGQLRPLVNMAPIAGRGRGDWRPAGIKNALPMQKSFHPGYGMPAWGNNGSGRGFGSGLEFTLPSHKTIFEVDIDNFEEKPWKLSGVEVSDFFNFGLNEETWKDYCKQLEQLRLEATMQSRIRVYETGRTEQEYDPDMPPELAAAAGIHDVSSENTNLAKADAGQSDFTKDARVRPQLPTGRAIQVETGYGERLPSIDTRPPRIRDSDAIIEIVLQDSADDDSTPGNDTTERPDNDPSRVDLSGGQEIEEDAAQDTEHFDNMPQAYNDRKREFLGRRPPLKNSIHGNVPEGDQISPFLSEAPPQYRPDSRVQNSVYPGSNSSGPRDERWTKGRTRDRSPNMARSGDTQDKIFLDNQKEDSVESVDAKRSPHLSSPRTVKTTAPRQFEDKDAMRDELGLADGSPEVEIEEMAFGTTTTTDSIKDENRRHSLKKQKLSSHVEQPSLQEIDDGEDSKAARSSENSKARSGSSRDYRNLRDSSAEEVIQDGRSMRTGIIRRPSVDDEHSVRSKSRDERQEIQRHRMALKGREDPYYRKSRDTNLAHHSHMKSESIVRRKESDNSDVAWQRKDEDPHGRRTRAEDMRKRELGDETGSRHRSKVRENDRSDKDEHQSRKQLDNGSWRGYHDKDMGSRHGDRDDSVKTRNDNMDDLHSRKRKEEAQRRDHAEKEEILHAHRENTSRRKRERDDALDHLPSKKDILDQRKRDDQARARSDDQRSVRHKEEGWFQRERVERQRERERDEWHGIKQPREESLSKREREEGRGSVRSGRTAEDKEWVSHSRVKDEFKGSDREYHFKDTGRHNEQLKRRDRVESESVSRHRGSEDAYAHGNQLSNDERKSRPERESTRSDRAVNASDNHRVHEKKHKENPRKSKESEGDHNSSTASRRNQEDHGGERVRLRGTVEPRKHKEDASSDEEQQDSRRGRSKLERWTSHKERDFSLATKSSSSLNVKENDGYKNSGPSLLSKVPEESSKTVETIAGPNEKEDGDREIKNADEKPTEDNRHLDTVAKLKKRSERFKLPMPSEKEALAIKKMENEPLPSSQTETRADSEVKHERPPRKRRWTSN